MKYMLFAGTNYYPRGGALDFIGFYPTVEDAQKAFVERAGEISKGEAIDNWGHVVDYETMEIMVGGVVLHSSKSFYAPGEPEWFPPV